MGGEADLMPQHREMRGEVGVGEWVHLHRGKGEGGWDGAGWWKGNWEGGYLLKYNDLIKKFLKRKKKANNKLPRFFLVASS